MVLFEFAFGSMTSAWPASRKGLRKWYPVASITESASISVPSTKTIKSRVKCDIAGFCITLGGTAPKKAGWSFLLRIDMKLFGA